MISLFERHNSIVFFLIFLTICILRIFPFVGYLLFVVVIHLSPGPIYFTIKKENETNKSEEMKLEDKGDEM